MNQKLKTPFSNLLPPLTTDEFSSLESDINAVGVWNPILIDEEGNILDGHHRFRIMPDAPRKIIHGLSHQQKQAFVFRSNFARRNLSPEQKKEALQQMKQLAKNLRQSDPKRWTQSKVAKLFGIDRSTVSLWFGCNGHNVSAHDMSRPDARIKIQPKARQAIVDRCKNGSNVSQVAADYGVSEKQIRRIKAQGRREEVKREERETAAKRLRSDNGIFHLDFREANLAAESVDLIFTDPPYDADGVQLFADLGKFADRVLRPGGWLLSCSGQAHLHQVMRVLDESKLNYGWTFCCLLNGSQTQFWKHKLWIGWKPIIGWYKGKNPAAWGWFTDVASGKREKDLHEWQLPESVAAYFIEHLCPNGGTVCDPFAGSGTSLVAAKKCGLHWIGYEIDEEAVETARIRLND